MSTIWRDTGLSTRYQRLEAIDRTHTELQQPLARATDDVNRKSKHSLNVQASCALKYCFQGCLFMYLLSWYLFSEGH